ncbi:MAG: adenylosuccinate lyase [Vulcanisaeta sp.]
MLVNFISPLDDRYYEELSEYARWISERAFFTYRARIEVLYLIFLIDLLSKKGIIEPLTNEERKALLSLGFSDDDYLRVKELENRLGHDVKALEYLLREKLDKSGLGKIAHLIHLGLTSEDVNNLALGVLIKVAMYEFLIPELLELINQLTSIINNYLDLPMLGRTHGQPATPTTFGKEIAYHTYRVCYWLNNIMNIKLQGKVSGATGSMASFSIISGDIDWVSELRGFVSELGFEPAVVTTQILPSDSITHLLTSIGLMSQSLINLAQDLWIYNMLGYIHVRGRPIGSSTMPHKVNPVDLESAEGNLKLGSSILMEISRYLQVSRLQRDLSDSTIKRNIGLGIGHVMLGIRRLSAVVDNIEVDRDAINRDLDEHWEVLSEAVQVRLRVLGMVDAYERALSKFRGLSMNREEYIEVLNELGVKDPELLTLSPQKYIGYARDLALECIKYCNETLNLARARIQDEVVRLERLGFISRED